jgi:hypothetical protein
LRKIFSGHIEENIFSWLINEYLVEAVQNMPVAGGSSQATLSPYVPTTHTTDEKEQEKKVTKTGRNQPPELTKPYLSMAWTTNSKKERRQGSIWWKIRSPPPPGEEGKGLWQMSLGGWGGPEERFKTIGR